MLLFGTLANKSKDSFPKDSSPMENKTLGY